MSDKYELIQFLPMIKRVFSVVVNVGSSNQRFAMRPALTPEKNKWENGKSSKILFFTSNTGRNIKIQEIIRSRESLRRCG
jgi:hypothetical protein